MKLPLDIYGKIVQLLDSGWSAKEVAESCGVKVHTVNNVKYDRVKHPGLKRKDAGKTKYDGRAEFLNEVRDEYLSQSKRRQTLSACVDNVRERMRLRDELTAFAQAPKATIMNSVYEASKSEQWETLFTERKYKHGYQAKLPKLWYDYWRLTGFMDYAVIDGRKADQWAAQWFDGRVLPPFMPQTFSVMELRTRANLHTAIKETAFNDSDVMRILLHLFLSPQLPWGAPHFGILCDNGGEQVSKDNVMAMELFWRREELERYRTGSGVIGFHNLFPGAKSPVVTSLPRIPTEFGKAPGEASFYQIQKRLDAFLGGDAYQGGGRNDVNHRSLTRVPSVTAKNSIARFVNVYQWFMTATEASPDGLLSYHQIERPKALKTFAKETGLKPTAANAVMHCLAEHNRRDIPEEHYIKILYWHGDRYENKRVDIAGQVQFQAHNETKQFWCMELTEEYVDKKITVVTVPETPHRAGLFDGLQFIGWANDIPAMMHNGLITVGDGRAAAKDVRDEVMRATHKRNRAIKERPHEVPLVLEAEEIRVFERGEEPPMPEIDWDSISPEMRADIERALG